MAGRYGLPTKQTFSKIIYLIIMLPHISLSIFCCSFVIIILPTTCTCILPSLSFFILTIQTSTPNPKNPLLMKTKRLKCVEGYTPDKTITTTVSFYASVLLPSYTSLTAPTVHLLPQFLCTPPCHSICFSHPPCYSSIQYNHAIKYNACVGPTTYFIYYIMKIYE